MFNNPGKSLKTIAKIIFWIAIVVNSLIGFIEGRILGAGMLVILGILLGILTGWLSSIFLYAIGEMVEDIHSMSVDNKETALLMRSLMREMIGREQANQNTVQQTSTTNQNQGQSPTPDV